MIEKTRLETLRVRIDCAIADIERLRLEAAKTRVARKARFGTIAVAVVACALVAGAGAEDGVVKAPFTIAGKGGAIVVINGDSNESRLDFYPKAATIGSPPVASIVVNEKESYFEATASTKDVKGNELVTGTELGIDGSTPYLRLYDKNDERLSLDVVDGKPFVRIKDTDEHGVVELGQGESGGGQLRLAKPGGKVMVLAGVSAGGVGRVETQPSNDTFLRGSPIGAFIVGVK